MVIIWIYSSWLYWSRSARLWDFHGIVQCLPLDFYQKLNFYEFLKVCRSHGVEYKSREFIEIGIGMCSTRWEATIPWSARTTCHAYFYIFNDRMLGSVDPVAKSHSNAGIIWSLSLHGRGIVERATVLWSYSHHVHASEISTGLYVLETGKHRDSILGMKRLTSGDFFRFRSNASTYSRWFNSLVW